MMKNIFYLAILLSLAISSTAYSQCQPLLPFLTAEPAIEALHDWDTEGPDMIKMTYDNDGDGRPDYITIRILINRFFSNETTKELELSNPKHKVLTVNYSDGHNYHYIVADKPLFYALDFNGDGLFDLMYKDLWEDGVNGNEEFHASPSGAFSETFIEFYQTLFGFGRSSSCH